MKNLINYNFHLDINKDFINQSFKNSYLINTPFPHVMISNSIDKIFLKKVSDEVSKFNPSVEKSFYGADKKFTESNINVLPKNTRKLLTFLNSDDWLNTLTNITGIEELIPDANFEGGGVHRTFKGGFLKVHTDFNWSSKLKAYRRINLIVYLNQNWNTSWGGECEFWSPDRKSELKKIPPLFNNMIIFNTNDSSFHGHPEPLNCPEEESRDSIAIYYYTKKEESVLKRRKTVQTNYQDTVNSKIRVTFFQKAKKYIPTFIKKFKY